MLTAAEIREKLAWAVAEKAMKLETPIDTGNIPESAAVQMVRSSQIPNANLTTSISGADRTFESRLRLGSFSNVKF